MLEPGKVLQGRYKVERFLGRGGMSTVYLAEHLKLGRKVALKALLPQAQLRANVEQLQREARIMASLSHPNLALVMDFFDEGGQPHLVMELVEGRDLEEVAKLAPKLLSQRRVLEFATQLLDVLEYLHTREPAVIVRDLKPSNVMLDGLGRLRLIDFGLAKFLKPDQTLPELGMGSLGYAPIEQFGHGIADQRSDIYALGATLFFLLTDQAPPDAASRVKEKTPVPDPRTLNDTVTAEMWTALQGMLEIDPAKRPANIQEVRRRLGLIPLLPPAAAVQPSAKDLRICPVCSLPLERTQQQKVEVDCCTHCGGVWLDRGELEQLVEVSQVYPAPPQVQPKRTLWEQLMGLIGKG